MTASAAADEVIPTGTYWDRETWDLARSAYVADLDTDPDSPDAFVGWLHRALEQHVQRGPEGRAALQIPPARRPQQGEPAGLSRTYPLRASTIDALEEAIIQDRQIARRMLSRSGFLREAVIAAARQAQARLATGATLPPAPERLPNRPVRRSYGAKGSG